MNATNHEFLPEELMAFLDGELSPERSAAISAHLNECADCSAVAADFGGLSKQVATWRAEQAPGNLGKVLAALTPGKDARGKSLSGGVSNLRPSSPLRWAVVAGSGVVGLLLLIVIATPNLLRSRIAANEASAVGSLRVLNTAAVTYLDSYGHYPPSLRSLGPPISGKPGEEAADLVDTPLASGRKSGYLFNYRSYSPLGSPGAGTYTIQADPLDPRYGVRRFSTDQTGALYANGVELGSGMPQERAQSNLPASRGTLGKLLTQQMQAREMDISEVPQDKGWDQNGPMIARTVSLSVVVKEFEAGRGSLDAILTRHNGYTASLNVTTPQGAARTLQASLRIPAPQLVTTLNELKALGRVEGETQNGEEVTQQHADLVVRIKNDRETEVRLQDILEKRTGKVKDVLEVEQEIARVRGEIEQMEAEQKTLEHRVDFATIDLKLAEEYKAQLNTPAPSALMQLRNAGVNGFRNAFESLLALVLFLAESGPSLLLWLALLGIPAWRLWKRYRRAQSLGSLAGA